MAELKKDFNLQRFMRVRAQVAEIYKNAREDALTFLKHVLNEQEDGSVALMHFDEDECCIDDNITYISFDGESHPEYYSDCFAEVESVYLDDDLNIMVELYEYGPIKIEHVQTYDLFTLIPAVAAAADYEWDE